MLLVPVVAPAVMSSSRHSSHDAARFRAPARITTSLLNTWATATLVGARLSQMPGSFTNQSTNPADPALAAAADA